MTRDYLIVDIATTPIANADQFLEEPSAPANYKDPIKIAAYIEEKKREGADRCGLDLDLGRITAIGMSNDSGAVVILICATEDEEREALKFIADHVAGATLVTYNGHRFDLPFLMRRALYLGVKFPVINLDRYKTRHLDLSEVLTNRGVLTSHSLSFYVKRLSWGLVKPLSGADEAWALQEGKLEELEASVRHDVQATRKLAEWLGVLEPVKAHELEPLVG